MQPVQVVRTPGGGGANGVDGGDGGATPEPTFRTCRVPSRLASSQLDTVAAISLPMHSCTVGSQSQLQALARPAPSAPWKLLLHIASEWLYDGPPVLFSPGERLHEGISQAQLEHEVQTRPGERRGTIMLYWRGAMPRSGDARESGPPVGVAVYSKRRTHRKPKKSLHSYRRITTEGGEKGRG